MVQHDSALDGGAAGDAGVSKNKSNRKTVYVIAAVAAVLVVGALLSSKGVSILGFGRDREISERAEGAGGIPLQQGEVTQVAPTGKPLMRLAEMPSNSHALVRFDQGVPDFKLDVTFEPYGLDRSARSLVIKVKAASTGSTDKTAGRFADSLMNQNMIVVPSGGVGTSVTQGGTYAGTIEVVKSGEDSVFRLVEAKLK